MSKVNPRYGHERIEHLTPEDLRGFEEYFRKYQVELQKLGPVNREEVRQCINSYYDYAGADLPEILFVRDPIELQAASIVLDGTALKPKKSANKEIFYPVSNAAMRAASTRVNRTAYAARPITARRTAISDVVQFRNEYLRGPGSQEILQLEWWAALKRDLDEQLDELAYYNEHDRCFEHRINYLINTKSAPSRADSWQARQAAARRWLDDLVPDPRFAFRENDSDAERLKIMHEMTRPRCQALTTDLGWTLWSAYLAKEFGWWCRELRMVEDLSKCTPCIVGYHNVVIVCDWPQYRETSSFTGVHILHSTEGPALVWGNKSLFAIRGVVVPPLTVLTPEQITPEMIASTASIEVRRTLIEQYVGGPGKYAQDAGAKCIDRDFRKRFPTDDAPVPRALFEFPDNSKWLVGTDGSTDRVYWMRVSNWVTTCAEAHMSINGGIDERRILTES